MKRLRIVIVTPALAEANNGNWQTAQRWARFLSSAYRVEITKAWSSGDEDLMIALHARRSAPSIQAWKDQRVAPQATKSLVLALTGTDLYRDIETDPSAQASVQMADRLIVLNECGPERLPFDVRARVRVVLQSCPSRQRLPKTNRHLRVLMVGHLREEKDPETYWQAVEHLAQRSDVHFEHIGQALDPTWAQQAQDLMRRCPQFRWSGPLPHEETRRRIQRAHLLVHASRMEGGAHVVTEAVRSGTPVLASRIDGNVGLLGPDHPAYFEPGDHLGLANLIEQARDKPGILEIWQDAVSKRAPLFTPEAEKAALLAVMQECVHLAS